MGVNGVIRKDNDFKLNTAEEFINIVRPLWRIFGRLPGESASSSFEVPLSSFDLL
jgi:hypothetical protein